MVTRQGVLVPSVLKKGDPGSAEGNHADKQERWARVGTYLTHTADDIIIAVTLGLMI